MSAQTVVSTTVDPAGQWQTVTYSDGSTSLEPVPGSVTATTVGNAQTIQQALQTAVTYFGGNYTNWSTLTTQQKDTAARNAQRALAQISRWLLGQFDSAG